MQARLPNANYSYRQFSKVCGKFVHEFANVAMSRGLVKVAKQRRGGRGGELTKV